jgi:PHD/YefM family antitoxin component YafN of YafNO toxin-antitoxin module
MPAIRNSADLRNSYSEISNFCHEYREPVFITKNGEGDLAVMSIETYNELAGKLELYALIQAGINEIQNGDIITESAMMEKLNGYVGA